MMVIKHYTFSPILTKFQKIRSSYFSIFILQFYFASHNHIYWYDDI